MDENGTPTGRFRIGAGVGFVCCADDGIALFDEAKEVGGMGWGAEIGPAGVLELGDFAHGLERLFFVAESEAPDDDVGLVAVFGFFAVELGVGELGTSRGALGQLWSLSVSVDARGLDRRALLGEEVEAEGTVPFLVPIVVRFDLRSFFLGRKHHDNADVLLPDDIPEVL